MKRYFRVILSCSLATAMFAIGAPTAAIADPAVIIQDGGCGMYDAVGNVTVLASDSIAVGTSSQNCNSTISCKAKGVTNTTGKPVKWNFGNTGQYCSTVFGITDKWNQIISTAGVASLVCHVNTCPD